MKTQSKSIEDITMTYVDGFLLPLPKANLEKYQKVAQRAGEIWKEHGAICHQ